MYVWVVFKSIMLITCVGNFVVPQNVHLKDVDENSCKKVVSAIHLYLLDCLSFEHI